MKIKYWTDFSKRKNSTKQPLDTQATEIDVKLKDDCSVVNPVIETSSIPINANYFYIDDFKRYYFLDNTERTSQQLKNMAAEVDVLATYKSQIGSTIAHIAYASTGFNKEIADGRIAVEGTKSIYKSTTKEIGFSSGGVGCYIIGVINNDNLGKLGAVSYFAVNAWDMATLFNSMLNSTFMNDLDQYFNGKTIDLITYCVWIPMQINALISMGCVDSGHLQINLGKESVNLAAYAVEDPVSVLKSGTPQSTIASIAIPNKWRDFRDCQPYSSLSIYLPGIGLTDLNINDFYNSDHVHIKTTMDITTGDVIYWLMDDNDIVMKTLSFNAASNVALAQISTNAAGALASIGGVAGGVTGLAAGAAMGNIAGVVGGGIGIMAGASSAVIAANQRTPSIKGTNNGRASFEYASAFLVLVQCNTEDCDDVNYIARCGRPVAKTQAISNHSGYVQCEGASCQMPGTAIEKDRVNAYLNSGFFYE